MNTNDAFRFRPGDLVRIRYSPRWIDGKRRSKNVYAHTREECEEKLKKLILQMKAELAELRASQRAVEQSDLAYHS